MAHHPGQGVVDPSVRAGVFGVVEVWVDDRYLVEVVIPKETARYRAFMNPEGCRAMFGESVAPPPLESARR